MTGAVVPDRLTLIAFAVMVLVAGGNAVGIAFVVREMDPFFAAAMRFGGAGLIFAGLMAALRVPLPRGRALAGALAYGAIGFFLGFGLTFWGLQETPPGAAQLILALVPLLTLLLAVAHQLEQFRIRAAVGAAIAFCGVVVLAIDRVGAEVPLLSLLAVVAGAVFLAETGVVLKLATGAHPVASNAVGMLVGGVLLAAFSAAIGEAWALPAELPTQVAMVFLILGGSVVVFGLFVFVLGRWSASAVSYQFLLIPLATIAYSAALTGERITLAIVIGGVIILLGVYLGALASHQDKS